MPTHFQGTSRERAALDVYIKLLRCADSVTSRLAPNLERHGLTFSQFGVMEALYHLGPLCLSELARKILRSGGNLTMVAKNLERHGFVRRVQDSTDRRVHRLELTASGKSLIRKVFKAHVSNLTRQMARLASGEQKELARLCKKLGIQRQGE